MFSLTSSPSRIGEDRIREAFEYAAAGMAITDLGGHFQQTNPMYCQILDRTERELERETIFTVTHEADRDECQRHIGRLLAGEIRSYVLEKRYVRPSGEAIWVRNSFSLLQGEDGRPTHIILICSDITERRRAEQLLLESEKLATVGQLASSIAHEISDPLEAVMNLLFLATESEDVTEARQYAVQAQAEINYVAQITTQMLHFRKQGAQPVPTRVTEIIGSVLTLYKAKLAQARVRVHLITEDAPDLLCYPGEIRQVFANIIRNAMEAMPKGGDLRVRVRPGTHWTTGCRGVRITVADTGQGIPAGVRAKIYEPFFTTKGSSGTGLGLWVTSKILQKHRGCMFVRSSNNPKDSWTAFSIVFPCTGAEGEAAGLTEVPSSKPAVSTSHGYLN